MKRLRLPPSPLVDVLVAPDAAFAALHGRPRLGLPLLVLGGASGLILLAQGALVAPVLRYDPLAVDLPNALAPSSEVLGWLRVLLAVVAPIGVALRALACGTLLHVLQDALGGRSAWRAAVSLVLHLEAIFLLESVGTLLVLRIASPESLEALRGLRFRAGLDLFWQPQSAAFAAACAAANAFVLWWGVLLLRGAGRLAGLPRRRAAVAVAPLWLLTVLLRFLLQPR